MHQYKVNAKAAFDGDVWQWHQDYGTWARDDGMPEPRAMNISVFLDEVMPINGPLMFIPRQPQIRGATGRPRRGDDLLPAMDARPGDDHPAGRRGRHRRAHRQTRLGADVSWQSGACLGPEHHALPAQIVYLTLCAVSNHIRKPTRPDWIAHRDFTPIGPVADGALLDYARRYKAAAE